MFRATPLILCALLAAACSRSAGGPDKARPVVAMEKDPAPPLDPQAPVARVDGVTITNAELDEALKRELSGARNEYLEKVHEIKAQGLESLINKRLLDKKAAAEKLTAEQLIDRDVTQKIPPATDAELHGVYDGVKSTGRELPPFDEIKTQIGEYIKSQKQEEGLRTYTDKLRAEAKVVTMLPALVLPKVEVSAEGPSTGEPAAPVTIVEFSDYQCPYCGRAEPVVRRILDEYKGKVRLVYREYPLPGHDHAQKASEAALCASDQGKYWEMHEKLFANQRALEVDRLKSYAKDLGLDAGKFDACLDSGAKAKVVEASRKAGDEAGVTGTPAFFINGHPLTGVQPFETFKAVIDAELGPG